MMGRVICGALRVSFFERKAGKTGDEILAGGLFRVQGLGLCT